MNDFAAEVGTRPAWEPQVCPRAKAVAPLGTLYSLWRCVKL